MQVIPAQGADQIIEFCGGLWAVLASAGVDMSMAATHAPAADSGCAQMTLHLSPKTSQMGTH